MSKQCKLLFLRGGGGYLVAPALRNIAVFMTSTNLIKKPEEGLERHQINPSLTNFTRNAAQEERNHLGMEALPLSAWEAPESREVRPEIKSSRRARCSAITSTQEQEKYRKQPFDIWPYVITPQSQSLLCCKVQQECRKQSAEESWRRHIELVGGKEVLGCSGST